MAHALQLRAEQDPATNDAEISSFCAPYNWHTWNAFTWLAIMSARCPVNDKREATASIWTGEGPGLDWAHAMRLGREWARLPRPKVEEAAA